MEGGKGFIAGSHDVEVILNGLLDLSLTHLRPGSFYNNLYSFVAMISYTGMISSNYDGEDNILKDFKLLRTVKKRYDPKNVLCLNLNIGTTE